MTWHSKRRPISEDKLARLHYLCCHCFRHCQYQNWRWHDMASPISKDKPARLIVRFGFASRSICFRSPISEDKPARLIARLWFAYGLHGGINRSNRGGNSLIREIWSSHCQIMICISFFISQLYLSICLIVRLWFASPSIFVKLNKQREMANSSDSIVDSFFGNMIAKYKT